MANQENIIPIEVAAQAALDVQDACNLSGVVLTFNDILQRALWPEARRVLNGGSGFVNHHPICFMFGYKILALNGHEPLSELGGAAYSEAEEACKQIIAAAIQTAQESAQQPTSDDPEDPFSTQTAIAAGR